MAVFTFINASFFKKNALSFFRSGCHQAKQCLFCLSGQGRCLVHAPCVGGRLCLHHHSSALQFFPASLANSSEHSAPGGAICSTEILSVCFLWMPPPPTPTPPLSCFCGSNSFIISRCWVTVYSASNEWQRLRTESCFPVRPPVSNSVQTVTSPQLMSNFFFFSSRRRRRKESYLQLESAKSNSGVLQILIK